MNVILMLADQLRADCLGCYGNNEVKTPNIDNLAANGTLFSQAFSQHPQCVPSRSSICTGRYPHNNGSLSNHTAMSSCEYTIAEHFKDSGYTTYCAGKLHLYDEKEKAGYQYKMMCGGQQSDAVTPEVLREDYKTWLKENGYWEKAKEAYAIHGTEDYWANFRSNTNPIPSEAYFDSWVGDRALEFINRHKSGVNKNKPFFMFIGFPNPHIPFDAPEPYASMYDPKSISIPETFTISLKNKPPQQELYKREGRRENFNNLSEDVLRRVIAYYYGSITLVDDQVGKVVEALKNNNMEEDTIVVFISDHGELLGHYGMLIKSVDKYPMLYDVGIHVPLIIRIPEGRRNNSINEMIELIDIYPTLAESCELEDNPWCQGYSQKESLLGGKVKKRDFVFFETGTVKGIRGEQYKLVYYPHQEYGELYDIVKDPLEKNNLFFLPDYEKIKESMTKALLNKLILTEAPMHGESKKGPAFWKQLYSLPYSK